MNRPSVVLLMTDQQRADFFAGRGFGLDTMPFLESLRPQGVWFPAAYTPNPICMPARVSMLTGRYTKAHSLIANWSPFSPRCGDDLPKVLRGEGYELALFGKNHTHAREADFDVLRPYMHTTGFPRPGREDEDRGFDAWMTDLGHWTSDAPTPFPLDCQYPVRIVDDALGWMATRADDRPFFAWVSFPEPHSPYQTPEPYFDLFPPDSLPDRMAGPEALAGKNHQFRVQHEMIRHYHPDCDETWRRFRSNYCGMLRLIDDQVKRLVDAFRRRGLLDNTLFVYTSDHGEFCGDYGLFRKGLALPECSIRVPMLWFGGPVAARGDHSAHVSLTDLFPTVCEAVGVEIPRGVQGRSLLPLLRGEAYSEREFASAYSETGIGGRVLGEDEIVFGEKADTVYIDGVARTNFDGTRVATSGYRRALVMGRYKLIVDTQLPVELYDLEADPAELQNLAEHSGMSKVRARLAEELLHWCIRLDDNLDVKRYQVEMPVHNWYR